jgi:hypothetical protein
MRRALLMRFEYGTPSSCTFMPATSRTRQPPPHLVGTSASTLLRGREVLMDVGDLHPETPAMTAAATCCTMSSVISG